MVALFGEDGHFGVFVLCCVLGVGVVDVFGLGSFGAFFDGAVCVLGGLSDVGFLGD